MIVVLTSLSVLMSLLSFQIPAARCIIPILLCGKYGSTKVFLSSSNLGRTLLAIQLHEIGKNSVSIFLSYTAIFIANPSDPKIPPEDKALDKISCQIFQFLDFFCNEKTPIFICGANAIFLAVFSDLYLVFFFYVS